MWHPERVIDDTGHLDEGVVHGWLDGVLDPASAAELEGHLAKCVACRAMVAEARGLIAGASRVLASLDDVATVTPVAPTRHQSPGPPVARLVPRPRWSTRRLGLAAAATLLFASGVVVARDWRSDEMRMSESSAGAPGASTADVAPSAPAPAPVGATPAIEQQTAGASTATNATPEARPATSRAAGPGVRQAEVAEGAAGSAAPPTAAAVTARSAAVAQAPPPPPVVASPLAPAASTAMDIASAPPPAATTQSTGGSDPGVAGRVAGAVARGGREPRRSAASDVVGAGSSATVREESATVTGCWRIEGAMDTVTVAPSQILAPAAGGAPWRVALGSRGVFELRRLGDTLTGRPSEPRPAFVAAAPIRLIRVGCGP